LLAIKRSPRWRRLLLCNEYYPYDNSNNKSVWRRPNVFIMHNACVVIYIYLYISCAYRVSNAAAWYIYDDSGAHTRAGTNLRENIEIVLHSLSPYRVMAKSCRVYQYYITYIPHTYTHINMGRYARDKRILSFDMICYALLFFMFDLSSSLCVLAGEKDVRVLTLAGRVSICNFSEFCCAKKRSNYGDASSTVVSLLSSLLLLLLFCNICVARTCTS